MKKLIFVFCTVFSSQIAGAQGIDFMSFARGMEYGNALNSCDRDPRYCQTARDMEREQREREWREADRRQRQELLDEVRSLSARGCNYISHRDLWICP